MTIEGRFFLQRDDFTLDAELSLPATGVNAVFGPSGCGKTTLLRALAGLEKCEKGFLSIGDEVWQDDQTFVPTHQRPLGFVFQEANLFPHLSVLANLQYGYKRLPQSRRSVEFEHVVELLGLKSLLHRDPAQLSGGERQRVAMGRALLASPRLLLMDEPLSALDQKSKQEIYPFLQRLHEALALPVLYVSHSVDEVARLGNHLVLMDSGRVVASGRIGDMFTRSDLSLIHDQEAEALIDAKVTGHDDEFHLTELSFSGGSFSVARSEIAVGQTVRLRILARDVSLTLEHQTDTSILNIFPVVVKDIIELSPAQLTVCLDANGDTILSRLTRKSASVLNLEKGKKVFAQVKSVAVLA